MPDRVISSRLFVDGVTRFVFIDQAGKQYVLGDGGRVEGVWVPPPEVPGDARPASGDWHRPAPPPD